jgi:hypothetical protein
MEDLTEDSNEEIQNEEESEGKKFADNLVRVMAIVFVFVIYLFIFFKILFLD